MDSSTFQYLKPTPVIFIISILVIPIFLIKMHWGFSIPALGAVAGVFYLITTKLWNIWPFKYMTIVDDFSGIYEGEIEYQYLDENCTEVRGHLKQIKVIDQNALKITISSTTYDQDGQKSSISTNKGMYVEKAENGRDYRLIYNYDNNGNSINKLDKHTGTEVLRFIKNDQGKFLDGEYYTSRLPHQSRGRISMKCTNKNLNHLIPQNYGCFK